MNTGDAMERTPVPFIALLLLTSAMEDVRPINIHAMHDF
jgi:hypothetical protein